LCLHAADIAPLDDRTTMLQTTWRVNYLMR
jgi:hypothetical protein